MKRKTKFIAIFGVMALTAWAGMQTSLAEDGRAADVAAVSSESSEETSAPATEAAAPATEAAAPATEAAAPATEAAAPATEAAPVTEATPATEATAATEAPASSETTADTSAAPTEAETPATETQTESSVQSETQTESGTDSTGETETESSSETDSKVVTEPTTEPASESESNSESESETTSETESEKKTSKKKETEKIDKKAAQEYETATGESIYVFGSYPAGNITDNTNEIYDYLRDVLGLNHAAACGVLANIQCESNFNSTAVGDGGTSYGLCQWHLGRFSQLISWCNANGYDYHSIEGQMGYLSCELSGGYAGVYQYLLSVPDTAEGASAAADYWCRYFEIPANIDYQAAMRADLAVNEYYPETLGTQEEESETETEVAVVSGEEIQEVVEQAPESIGSLSRLSVTKETTVETEASEEVSTSMSREELERTTQEAIAQALEEYETEHSKEDEQTELTAEEISLELARLSNAFTAQ